MRAANVNTCRLMRATSVGKLETVEATVARNASAMLMYSLERL